MFIFRPNVLLPFSHIPDYAKIASCLTGFTKWRQPAALQRATIDQNTFKQLNTTA